MGSRVAKDDCQRCKGQTLLAHLDVGTVRTDRKATGTGRYLCVQSKYAESVLSDETQSPDRFLEAEFTVEFV